MRLFRADWACRPKFLACFLLTLATPAMADPKDEGGMLDRLVSYFSGDLKNIDEELLQLKPLINLPAIQSQQTLQIGFCTKVESSQISRWVSVDLGKAMNIDAVVLVPLNVAFYGGWAGPGYGFPARYRVEVSLNPDFSNSDVIVQDDGTDIPNPGMTPRFYPTVSQNVIGRYVRVAATKMWAIKSKAGEAIGPKILALGELMVLSDKLNVAAGLPPEAVTCSDSREDSGYSKAYLVDGQSILGAPVSGDGGPSGFQSQPVEKRDTPTWVQIDLEQDVEVEEVRLLPAWSADSPERRGYGFPTKFRVELADNPNMTGAKFVGEYSGQNSPNENPVTIRGNGTHGRYIRLTATSLSQIGKGFALALGEMEVYAESDIFSYGKTVTASSNVEKKGVWSKNFLVDGYTSQGKLVPWQAWFEGLEKRKDALVRTDTLIQQREVKAKSLVETVIRSAGYVVGGLVILFVYFSFRSLLKKRRALEDLRTRIARDIHDEIGSGLGTISLLSRMAQEGDLDDAKEDLKEIYRISVSMSEAMRDIVWFNRTDVDTVRDLLMRMRETADGMMAKHNSFNFETFGEGLVRPISMEIRREIFLIFKEALHNILKHANAQRVDVRAGLEGNEFILSIRDDGKGFDKLRETSGAGMGSMKKRAESLRGSLSLESTPGAGTSLNLRAKLK